MLYPALVVTSRPCGAFTDAVQIRLQGVPLPFVGTVPAQAIQALP